jgi:hypothetical protein
MAFISRSTFVSKLPLGITNCDVKIAIDFAWRYFYIPSLIERQGFHNISETRLYLIIISSSEV